MHRFAADIKKNDQFLMGANLFTIIEDAAETSSDDMVKITFLPAQQDPVRRCTMMLPRTLLVSLY